LLGLFFKNRYLKYGSKFIKYANNPAKAYHELRFQGKGPFEPIKRIFELDTDVLNKCVLADIKLTLSNNYLHNSDRMNMAHSLEARPPFTDYKLIEFFMNIPIEYKLRWFQSRILVKLLMKTKLPEKILTQKKFGFNAPLKDWYLSYLKKKYIKYIPEKHLTDTNENINEAFKHITFNVWRKIYGVQG
jgi:asparagine synthetase B (glutamine-hydrolysing)